MSMSMIPVVISSHLGVSLRPPNIFITAINCPAIIMSQRSVSILFVFVKKFRGVTILAFLRCKVFDLPVYE